MRSVEVPEYEVHGEVRVDPARTALVVDMQNDFVKEGGSLVVPDAEATIPIIRPYSTSPRSRGRRWFLRKIPTTRVTRSGRSGRNMSGKARGAGR